MLLEDVGLELIDDNPFNPRLFYKPQKVADKAESIKQNGLLQRPKARRVNGRVQLAFGGYRKRAFGKLHKEEPQKWASMPLDIEDLTDDQMIIFAIEENLKRDDNSPIEVARALEVYFKHFPEATETALGKKMNMTQGNISNMRRVLTLPEAVLEKIDEGRISFTMGRELLLFKGLNAGSTSEWSNKERAHIEHQQDDAYLMKEAIKSIRTPESSPDRYTSEAPTVDGMRRAIAAVVAHHFKQLDKEVPGHYYSYGGTPLFDSRAAGCLKCERMILTHPTKSGNAHYCTAPVCWEKHQQEHQTKMATQAVAKRQADLQRIASEEAAKIEETISQEIVPSYKLEKRGSSWIALDDQLRIIAESHDKKVAEERAKVSFEPVATVINPGATDYRLNHTYRISLKTGRRPADFIFDYTAQDLATAIVAAGVSPDDIESVKVHKASGKLGTAGDVSAGWSKCTEPMEQPDQTAEFYKQRDFTEEVVNMPITEEAVAAAEEHFPEPDPDPYAERRFEDKKRTAERIRNMGDDDPCKVCVKAMDCDGTSFHRGDDSDKMVCHDQITRGQVEQKVEASKITVPEELSAAMVKAGTRGQVVDLNGLWADNYGHENVTGYIRIDNILKEMEDTKECLERCTRGFHYAFDSSDQQSRTYHICDDKKCVARKKSAFTRAKNAKNNAKKNAERAAFKTAVDATSDLDLPRMKLILYAQLNAKHCDRSSYSGNTALTWLCNKLKVDAPQGDGKEKGVWQKVNKMEAQELARLLVDFMLNMLTYQPQSYGFYGSNRDFQDYKIQTTEVLNWMGVGVQVPKLPLEVS